MANMYVALPIYSIIDVADQAEAQRARQAVEQLLSNEMVKFALAQAGVRVHQMSVGEPYPCAAPGTPQNR